MNLFGIKVIPVEGVEGWVMVSGPEKIGDPITITHPSGDVFKGRISQVEPVTADGLHCFEITVEKKS
jgi:hypothetical protein